MPPATQHSSQALRVSLRGWRRLQSRVQVGAYVHATFLLDVAADALLNGVTDFYVSSGCAARHSSWEVARLSVASVMRCMTKRASIA